ncbi:YhgE/Pip domain-containing protein [Gordonia sp. (in: high G+C Gram-positive bacteria)]|uniref:YhgE/Pip domain-containing protein n=1 Tax=unclassified Gordonia (in: high G+C Gram-positive bacteria) TaxID=2657482 RepID=UPI0026127973|nr:YhgE/Pip domain-containing protein [Gordonia sp. (in: high G+C Gram-positive bacteria)]
MLAAFSPGSDFKRYYRGRMPRLALLVIMVMPLMYGALYLWAFWNPFNEVNRMPVAVVNLDKGAEVNGQRLDAGKQVIDGLVASKQLDLHIVSEDEATNGLYEGKYYFSITLPANFSESLASPMSGNAKSADLIFTYNDANNYLSTVIGQDAAAQVVNQVGAQVGAQTFGIVFQQAGPMLGKITEAADGAGELATGLKQAKGGADELNAGVQELAGGVMSATDPLLAAAQEQQSTGPSAAELKAKADRLGRTADTIDKRLGQASTAQSQAYDAVVALSGQLKNSPDPNVRALAPALEPVKNVLYSEGLGPNAQNDLTELKSDSALLAAQLNNPSSPLRKLLALIESGNLVNDIEQVRSAVTQLSDGTDQLASGLGQLSTGADQLAAGLKQGADAIPHWSKKQQEQLAQVLGNPVQLKERYENRAATFGTGFAPFFFGLALFVGSIIAWMLFTPLQARPIAHGLNSFRVVLASFAPTLAVGAVQAAILYVVTVFAVGLRPLSPWATFFFMVLMVAVFMALIQMLNAVFGSSVGRVVTLALLMLMLTSAGGIYPVQTTAKPFQWMHPFDPMTYTVNGLRILISGGNSTHLWISVGVLLGLTLVFLAISTWAAHRNRQYNMERLYPPVEV